MLHRPPDLTLTARFFVRLVGVTERLSRRRAWAFSIACVFATVLLDHVTGLTFSLSFLYLLTAASTVWCLGERKGLSLTTAGVVVGAIIRHYDFSGVLIHGHGIGLGTEIWNAFARIISVGIVAAAVDGLRGALALERWRASSDELTGALNKAAFQECAALTIQRARVDGNAIVLAYMDLDGFKGVNDRYGHSAGDRVLRTFASAAEKAIRGTDLFARIGGDEFVALMTVRTCEEGDQVAEMFHGRLSTILHDTGFAVTCSMGALVGASEEFDLDGGGLELADMLMYEVKHSGKNALRIARAGGLATTLRSAYPVAEDDDLSDLLMQIDTADSRFRTMDQGRFAL